MKSITITLDNNSIDKAIQEIQDYRDSITEKLKILINQLTQEGVTVARYWVDKAQGDSTDAFVDYTVDSTSGDIIRAQIFLQGTDALFIEFGAGIAYNTGKQHPYASELGYGVGTYPSEHPPNRAMNPGAWVYGHDDDGTPLWSIGTEATMPIYNAGDVIRNLAITKALEIFRS